MSMELQWSRTTMSTHSARRTSLATALSLAGLLAAATAFRPAVPATHHTARRGATVLQVENDGVTDRIMYLVTESGMRQRLGTASAVSTTTFTIPSMFVGRASNTWFEARRFAGYNYEWSPQMFLSPGDTVHMMIQSGVGVLEVASVTGGR
jgi:hypothetical protein